MIRRVQWLGRALSMYLAFLFSPPILLQMMSLMSFRLRPTNRAEGDLPRVNPGDSLTH